MQPDHGWPTNFQTQHLYGCVAQDLFLKQNMSKGTKELSLHPLEEHNGVIWTRLYIISPQKTERPMKDKSNIIRRAQVNLKITFTCAKELHISADNVVQQRTEAQKQRSFIVPYENKMSS